MAAPAQAQPCPCSSVIFFSHLGIPTNRVQIRLFPRSRSLASRCLTAQATRQSSGGSRPWDSNAESVRAKRFESKPLDDEEDKEYQLGFSGILEEAIDSIWIFQVLKSFGWLLPAIILSALLTTGAKAFLTALAVSVGLSAIPLALGKFLGLGESEQTRRRKRRKSARRAAAASRELLREEAMRGMQESRQEVKGYRSSVAVENGSSSSVGEGGNDGSSFGGWEELDWMEYERRSSRMSSSSERSTLGRENRRVEVGRSSEPLLLRLLVAVFPILGSWTRMFW